MPRFGPEIATHSINRAPMPAVAFSVPWLTVALASMAPAVPLIVSAPLLPPLGYLMLIGWRQMRPGLLPIWAGLPLGAIDDIYSGQPFGSAILLWSLTMIALDVLEARVPWRNFIQEWLVATALIAGYLLLGLGIVNVAGGTAMPQVLLPQILLAVAMYPLVGRVVAACDRFRLLRFRVLG
jgi:rod shape-determining protein MreD